MKSIKDEVYEIAKSIDGYPSKEVLDKAERDIDAVRKRLKEEEKK